MISILIFNLFNFLVAQDMSLNNSEIVNIEEYDCLNIKTVTDSDTNNYFGAFSLGAGLNHGGIGIKALIGKKEWGGNSGIFGSVGTFNSKISYSIGVQAILYKRGYITLGYGDVGTETIDYSKEKVQGISVVIGYLWNIGKKQKIFIDTGLGFAYGVSTQFVGITGDLSIGIRF